MSDVVHHCYVIRVRGHVDEHWSGFFDGLAITLDPDGTSTLTGPVVDQSHLLGILAGLRDIGATLLEVQGAEQPADAPQTRA